MPDAPPATCLRVPGPGAGLAAELHGRAISTSWACSWTFWTQVARMTKTTSSSASEWSRRDVVSFGVAPAFVLYSRPRPPLGRAEWSASFLFDLMGGAPARRFNVYAGVTDNAVLRRVPIPAAAAWWPRWCALGTDDIPRGSGPRSRPGLLVAILMVTTFRYYSLKEDRFRPRRPAGVLVLVVRGADRRHSSTSGVCSALLRLRPGARASMGARRRERPAAARDQIPRLPGNGSRETRPSGTRRI